MRVLGIDPGTIRVGFGVVEAGASTYRAVAFGVVASASTAPLPERLRRIHAGLTRVIARTGPDLVAIEDAFSGINPHAALRIGEGRGVALLCAGEARLPVFSYAPTEVKRAVTGGGGARKASVARMVAFLLGLPREPSPEDASDALAVALCHCLRAPGSR
ncbi:MAG: crossover junction endodeoxyribonuclease RuvC [Planctomycetales bacterium]|nr:crossover junction endodeoxyribonuclease RuvC [Planctomycetales bacterium]